VNTPAEAAEPFLTRMHERGLKARAIANLLGINESEVSRWKSGDRSPDARMRRLMAAILAGIEAEL
jgi:transcriptional regulator with XRE-family HTH domain